VSCSNNCASIEYYTILLLLWIISDNWISYSWPNHSSDVAKWNSRGK